MQARTYSVVRRTELICVNETDNRDLKVDCANELFSAARLCPGETAQLFVPEKTWNDGRSLRNVFDWTVSPTFYTPTLIFIMRMSQWRRCGKLLFLSWNELMTRPYRFVHYTRLTTIKLYACNVHHWNTRHLIASSPFYLDWALFWPSKSAVGMYKCSFKPETTRISSSARYLSGSTKFIKKSTFANL